MIDKLIPEMNFIGNYFIVDETNDDKNLLSEHNYKTIMYLREDELKFPSGSIIIAEKISGELIYYNEFENLIREEYKTNNN